MEANGPRTLQFHLQQVKEGKRRYENAFQTVARMILENNEFIERIMVNGKSTYNFKIFRMGNKQVIGMYDEINRFVSCIQDATEGGSSREMAFVLVGEPGNGKTFFVDTLRSFHRNFMARRGNRR